MGRTRTALAVPGAPPQQVRGVALDSRSLRISWEPPPRELHNGAITYYKVKYIRADAAPGAAPYEALKGPAELSHTITGLDKWTPYRVWVLAGTSVGDGPASPQVLVRTDEDGTSSDGDAPFPSSLTSFLPPHWPFAPSLLSSLIANRHSLPFCFCSLCSCPMASQHYQSESFFKASFPETTLTLLGSSLYLHSGLLELLKASYQSQISISSNVASISNFLMCTAYAARMSINVK